MSHNFKNCIGKYNDFLNNTFIYLGLHWVFIAVPGLFSSRLNLRNTEGKEQRCSEVASDGVWLVQ